MLLIDGTGIQAPNLHARLYLADPNGGNRRPLGDSSGGVMMSSFSPDAHYLLLTMRAAETATTRLLDLTGSQPAHVLAQGNRDPRVPYYYDAFGAFLGLGPHAGDGLLTWTDGSQRHFRLIDPRIRIAAGRYATRHPFAECLRLRKFAGPRGPPSERPGP